MQLNNTRDYYDKEIENKDEQLRLKDEEIEALRAEVEALRAGENPNLIKSASEVLKEKRTLRVPEHIHLPSP